jgi:hypothetical protein
MCSVYSSRCRSVRKRSVSSGIRGLPGSNSGVAARQRPFRRLCGIGGPPKVEQRPLREVLELSPELT